MKLPPKVHPSGPTLYYVHKGKWHSLCPVDSPEHVIIRELAKMQRRGFGNIAEIAEDYKRKKLPRLKPITQKEYTRIIDNVLIPEFGHMHPNDLTSQDCAAYLEYRENQGKGPAGNRELATLSSIYNHAMRVRAANFNPTYGVKRNKESKKTRYVTNEELRRALKAAPAGYRYLMWAAYLTGYRQKDLIELKRTQITPEGIKVEQSKDGKHIIIEWSDSLRKLIRRAVSRTQCDYVFANELGRKWATSAIQCAHARVRAKTGDDWTFHSLRAKAESDHQTGLGLMTRYKRATRLKAVK